ncbi:hypothetical protein Q2941_50435 [Bradyrhizobium sp. UFLA05-153]
MTAATLPNPFMDAPLTSLEDQIENVQLKLNRMGRIAETGRDFAAIAEVEARELMPLLAQRSSAVRPARHWPGSPSHMPSTSR